MLINVEYEELFFENDGVRLHAVASGPVVVLLHGFPEFWYGWRHQIGPSAAAGFRVVAFDQGGYNPSSKPPAVSDYADRCWLAMSSPLPTSLVASAPIWQAMIGSCRRMGRGPAISPATAQAGHHQRASPSSDDAYATNESPQWRRRWYVLFSQLPRLPETAFSAFSFYLGARSLLQAAVPVTFTVEDLFACRFLNARK
jgi:epoxide hydrolase 4